MLLMSLNCLLIIGCALIKIFSCKHSTVVHNFTWRTLKHGIVKYLVQSQTDTGRSALLTLSIYRAEINALWKLHPLLFIDPVNRLYRKLGLGKYSQLSDITMTEEKEPEAGSTWRLNLFSYTLAVSQYRMKLSQITFAKGGYLGPSSYCYRTFLL